MTLTEVVDVQQLAPARGILGFLDDPKAGRQHDDGAVQITGWALGRQARRAAAVELRAGGRTLERLPLGVERKDVAAAHPTFKGADRAGFRGRVGLTGMAPLDLAVDAVLEDGSRVSLATVRARRRFDEQRSLFPVALVSVIVTVLDSETSLERALESVLAQTYPSFELLVVVPSGDSRIAEVAERYTDLTVIDSGSLAGAVRNAGLRKAQGSIVVFLDAAERLVPDALEIGLHELAAHPECAFVSGRCLVSRPYHQDAEFPQQPLVTGDHYETLLGQRYVLTPAAAIFRRAGLDAIGGFDEALEAYDDYDLYLRLANRFRIACHGQAVVESPAPDPLASRRELAETALARALEKQGKAVAGDLRLERALGVGSEIWRARDGLRLETLPAPGRPVSTSPPGTLDFGELRRVRPLSTNFGYDRGTPIDRYYIERFLAERADEVRGRVLEVQENDYTKRFGGDRVERSDVLSLLPDNPKATIVADLASDRVIPRESFDCAIVTQVLHLIPDPLSAIRNLRRILRPEGIALVTVPGISQVEWSESWYWSFTVLSAQQLFAEVFGSAQVRVRGYGNVLAATSFLWGVAVEELEPEELDAFDPNYHVTIAVRAVKSDSH
jgi:SAM-dependent methyltransferase